MDKVAEFYARWFAKKPAPAYLAAEAASEELASLCLFGCFSKGPGIGSRSGTGTIYGCQGPTS
jgi:hypothetical protein